MEAVGAQQGRRVLIVEDEELVAYSLARLLRVHGFSPEIAPSVTSAIDALDRMGTSSPFEHVLLDLKLPDGDGENVLAQVERMALRPNVIIIAAPECIDGHRILSLRGRCEYLPKPVIVDTLLVMLERRQRGALADYTEAFGLSEQESAVLGGAVLGMDDRAIGLRIACARTTVKSYWGRIYAKVGRRGRDKVLAHLAQSLIEGIDRGSGAYRPLTVPRSRAPKSNT